MYNLQRTWKTPAIFLLLIVVMVLSACKPETVVVSSGKPVVFVSNYPLKYFVERLAGTSVDILFLVPDEVDPAFWEPTLEEITQVQSADLLLFIGADYEKWVRYISIDEDNILETGEALKEFWIETIGSGTHSHGLEGDHSHGGTAFTLWLDMNMAAGIAAETARGLASLIPESATEINQNLEGLNNDLNNLDNAFKIAAGGFEDLEVMASHPIYQYFSIAYLPNLSALLWEPDVYPGPSDWADFNKLLDETDASFMIWEGEPLPETQAILLESGLPWAVINPCFNTPDKGDFLSVMADNAANLAKVVQQRND